MTKEEGLKQEINRLQGMVARQAIRMMKIRRVVEAALANDLRRSEAFKRILDQLDEAA